MRLSEVSVEQMASFSMEQVTEIVFGGWEDDGEKAIAALLLGGNPIVLRERAQGAAQLYHEGKVPLIIPTGGVQWDTDSGRMSEAEYLKMLLKEYGVPEEAIALENEATTTRENMILGGLMIERRLRPRGPFRVYVVSSRSHLRRSLALARNYLPRTATVIGHPGVCPEGTRDQWYKNELQRTRGLRELEFLKKYVDTGEIEDIEF